MSCLPGNNLIFKRNHLLHNHNLACKYVKANISSTIGSDIYWVFFATELEFLSEAKSIFVFEVVFWRGFIYWYEMTY